MTTLTLDELESDQQNLVEKTDIETLAYHCKELQAYEEEIEQLEEQLKYKKEKKEKISSEIIPNILAEQGLSSLKLADGSSIDVIKKYRCTIKKDEMESAYNWLRENELDDIIKNEVAVTFGKGEDTRAQELLSLAGLNGYEPTQRQKVEPMTLMALYRERVEAGLVMPSDSFNLLIQDETKISRKK